MTAAASPVELRAGEATGPRIDRLPDGRDRGTLGMTLVITTEALLFVTMFFAYFYVGHRHPRWPAHPPQLRLALLLLALLVISSGTLHLAESCLARGARTAARLALLATIALGAIFAVVQVIEYRQHLTTLQPRSNAYGSLFYVITSFHGLHVAAGLAMLIFVACLPTLEPARSPHRPLRNAARYWHFVDVVWIVVVALLYVLPWWEARRG
jgi:heme/copper-type cytochrome/quinol oxidase subunit 3